ncbi:NAD(P)H pyrophosphatase NUDT13, mitochondrial isoform X3 [Crotalus tigris]|uniref:NAD(P)H pyrophosphatase NUDT13, mitochondrial isoform X3 n=1 Tax=Crotalus tigris TaxID=88082 RepID=UPI00192F82B6|nr:NAD(P)H pyrophosphatase NUDT13, mitochondrial isoform X3 [Crotalus tigris]
MVNVVCGNRNLAPSWRNCNAILPAGRNCKICEAIAACKMVITLACQVGYRRTSALCNRIYSTYVRRMRYMFKLKEDDDACRQAYNSGTFFLFYNFSPFVQQKGKALLVPKLKAAEIKRLLQKFQKSEKTMEESMLVGCSEECTPYFALDLGSLPKSAVESELDGSFGKLQKAFFQLEDEDASLISTSQALLQWHNNNQYCGKTGEPTVKNLAGSKRICHNNGIVYYPQMSPVVIALVSDGSRCLLVRQASFPKGMYSALAGFCDVGESLEETVQREVAEEIGLECTINTQELESARWFSHEEVVKALEQESWPSKETDERTSFWVPPKQAIARRLIQEWVKQKTSP